MTIIEELEQRLEVMEKVTKAYGIFKEEVEQLQKALAELKESKKEGKWKPKNGEKFWFRNVRGESESYTHEDFFNSDKWLINNLPIFPTKEQCERYWHFMDTVKEKSYSFSEEEWLEYGIRKYFIYYNYRVEQVEVGDEFATRDFNKPYFKTEEDAQYIIDNFKEELMEFFV